MDPLVDVVLTDLAKHAYGLNQLFRAWFRIGLHTEGNSLVIKSKDARRAFAERPTLRIHPRITLTPGSERSHAANLAAPVPATLDQYRPPTPNEVHLQGGFGHISTMEEILTLVTLEQPCNLETCLAERLLPAMTQVYGARYVTGISIDAEYQQACMSFIKIALLSERYGIDKAKALVQERNALAGALPHGMSLLAYVDVLTRFSPVLFSLPVSRSGCTWHFQNDSVYWFSKAPGHGVVQQFMTDFSPLAESTHYLGLPGLKKPNDTWVLHLLQFVTDGVNNLLCFLNDPRNFINPDGTANFLKQIQAHSAVQLIFADVNALNYSTFAHNRISYAMSALDKLANLRASLGGGEETMQKFAALSQSYHLKHLILAFTAGREYSDVGRSIVDIVDICYDEIHGHLATQSIDNSSGETERLRRIWMQRNVRHGTFLKKEQFEKLFFEADGTIVATIGTLPFLLLVGLISNPKGFLTFQPHVGA